MTALLDWLLSSRGYMPHGHCYLWQPGTLWLNVGSDALIAGSYFAIPLTLNYFVRHRRSEIPFPWILLMFAAFIFLCGSTHAMEIWTVWHPDYRLAGALKLVTALVSLGTSLALFWLMPYAMQLRSPRQLHAEVAARTAELAAVNARLQREIAASEAAQAQLREFDRRKDEFLATLAHELRNPLAPIRAAAAILASPALAAPQLEWSRNVIQRQVTHMARLLDDLLDVERITQGKLELKLERVAFTGIVDAAIEAARPLIDSRNQQLSVTLPATPVLLDADPLRLSQVLSNLLNNAAKYTDPGGAIALDAHVVGDKLEVVLRDNGIGIPPDALRRIFSMFSQVESALTRAEGGLGIGLALASGVVALHGGSIEARSEGVGRGSEFIVRLPVAKD
jgi:signal transduction histidine kinase